MPFPDRKLRQAALFYAISISLTTILALMAIQIGQGVLFITMFAPALAVIACRLTIPEGQRFRFAELGLSGLGLRYWRFAIIVPFAVILPGYLLVWLTAVGTFSPLPTDENPLQLAVRLAVSIPLGAALGAFGEEIGWRGYLLPRLVDRFGETRAGLLTGFLHGVWHLPLILLTPYYHADAPAFVVIPLFLTALTLSGPTFAYLRIASGSVVPVALMHSAWNSYWDAFASRTTGENKALIAILSGEAGIITIAMLALVAVWIRRRSTRAAVGRPRLDLNHECFPAGDFAGTTPTHRRSI